MGRNISPVLRRQLENLDKDAGSRRSAMKALKSYVKDLDSKAIPSFLAQVSETKDPGSPSREYTISLYELLARVHGTNIIPQIDNIMATIIKTLTSSAGSFHLHQACSKVVPAIARYGIDPSAPEEKKRKVIHSLCKPLSDSLLGSQEGLASGAALCLKALVESGNWSFASDEIVNDICLRVAGALEERPTQTNSHMGLAMALAKHNNLTVEAYARSLIRSGLRILNAGVAEENSQKRLNAIHMVNFLMKCLDPRSIFSELGTVIEEMEKFHCDQMVYVSGAAFEALQTARKIAAEEVSRFENPGSITGSNFGRRNSSRRKFLQSVGDRSPGSASPESQTFDSFVEYDSLAGSPMSMGQVSCNYDYSGRSQNGGVDVSLKDYLFPEVGMGSNISNTISERFGDDELSYNGDHSEVFSGFLQGSLRNGVARSSTPSPQGHIVLEDSVQIHTAVPFTRSTPRTPPFLEGRLYMRNIKNMSVGHQAISDRRSHSQLNIDNFKIFSTLRKLICALQDPNYVYSDFSQKQVRRFSGLASSQLEWSPTKKFDRSGLRDDPNTEAEGSKNLSETGEQVQEGSESVSSTGDVPANADQEVSHEVDPEVKTRIIQSLCIGRSSGKAAFNLACGLFFMLLAVMSVLWIYNQEEIYNLVPT
ncbi:hypothetical protein HHK36_017538 [Tetracentron sinense]|uniref:TORTIFOLIA1/SINE1-2 N-terminal domain-containing protein n=1 Tax=Tetracentron sinense TaxID=13715 RepID=A0A834Z2N9_TETSI|nr:hypothetical protein HHK36_017538 [Tetracentron sinense]